MPVALAVDDPLGVADGALSEAMLMPWNVIDSMLPPPLASHKLMALVLMPLLQSRLGMSCVTFTRKKQVAVLLPISNWMLPNT